MPITLNHTIVHARDAAATAAYFSELLGIAPAKRLAHFTILQIGDTSLDLIETDAHIASRHFAFLVSEKEFDDIFERIKHRDIRYWADPFRKKQNQINHWDDGRGLYFDDPNGHLLEIITRPYGSGGCVAVNPNPLLECPQSSE
jgi:catechol 2,3-dioxygenase-like lactoylglutathione lyase family enzyme